MPPPSRLRVWLGAPCSAIYPAILGYLVAIYRPRYVVDSVSRAGEHKVVALWRYDKRDYYGSSVVYHGVPLHYRYITVTLPVR